MYDQTIGNPFGPANSSPLDNVGIIRADKIDAFFGTQATTGRVDWLFDISGADELSSIQIDMAARGDFVFANKRFQYRIDGDPFVTFASLGSDVNAVQTYLMENGLSYDIGRPLRLNGGSGPLLNNVLTTYTFDDVDGRSGSVLAIRFATEDEFGGDVLVFDNLVVNGTGIAHENSEETDFRRLDSALWVSQLERIAYADASVAKWSFVSIFLTHSRLVSEREKRSGLLAERSTRCTGAFV